MAVMVAGDVDAPAAVKERLEAFAGEVLAEAMNRPVQLLNGGLYLRGLLEQGARKSLEPMVERLGGDADYQSMQQFVADSPWDPALVVKAVAERVAPEIDVEAWVLDDTGFPKDGKDSPGVKRQYSGTLGKTGNCQIGVSVHAVGARGTVPLGWALYLPEDWCEDAERRRKAKIPERGRVQDQARARGRAGRARRRLGGPEGAGARRSRLRREHLAARSPRSGRLRVRAVGRARRRRCSSRAPSFAVPPKKPRAARAPVPAAAGPQARADRRADRPARSRQRADGHLPRRPRRRAGHLQVHLRARPRRARLARRSATAAGGAKAPRSPRARNG